MYQKYRNIHMVGIGGVGMCGIAELLFNLNYLISGSDLVKSSITERLAALGMKINFGHKPEYVVGTDLVVYSSAVKPDNPEIIAARDQNIPVIPRAEMLAELMRLKYSIAVSGAHGKTTTTSMIAMVLTKGGLDPTIVLGGRLNTLGAGAKLGQGDFLVAEADESDGSFLKLSPTIAVVTNIDREHLDYFQNLTQIKNNFLQFVQKVPFYGAVILCLDDEHVRWLLPRLEKRIITYGLSSQALIKAARLEFTETKTSFDLIVPGEDTDRVTMNVPGQHNVLNALAAVAVARELEIPYADICTALTSFQPPDRRFEIKATVNDILIIDDYGHHPQEISVTLKAAKQGWNRRIVAVFQPHRYTRTRDLLSEFFTAFYESDVLVVTRIYPAGETPIEGVDAVAIAEGIRQHGHQQVLYIEDFSDIVTFLKQEVKPGDLLITLGAGNIVKVAEMFIQEIRD
ncbi:UDP-N-acetylmuramate--L-alanine ligase [candidate division CSSED10-310 bacterium]|uniref:UDP-N-acetylmuramate--L-alanine ligase n=1 Tax=candidate division CSSED10-310 bacterium TaxID=2855610 RepID=A0ABV6YV07_UNCC1